MLIKLDLVGIQFFPSLSSCESDFHNAFLLLLKAIAELQRTSGLQIAATAKHLGNLFVGWFWFCLGVLYWQWTLCTFCNFTDKRSINE